MHMHARVRPWNNVRPGYFALVMYLSNDIYTYVCIRFSLRTLSDSHACEKTLSRSLRRVERALRKFAPKSFRSAKKTREV